MADNSLSSARPLGVLGSKLLERRDLVGPRDRTDFFKFSLKRSSDVNFQLSNLQANADLLLLNRSGKAIARSQKGGKQAEQITRQLQSGTYYVQVSGRGSKSTRYKLAGSTTAGGGGSGGSGGNGTRSNPFDLGTLNGGSVARSRDTAGTSDAENKFYKFRLGQISDLSIALSQVSGGGTMRLYNDTNRNGVLDFSESTIDSGDGSVSSNRPISAVFPSTETYFLQVVRDFSASTMQYDITFNTTQVPGNIPTDPGSEPTTAFNLGSLSKGGRLEAKDYVGRVDENDLYRFTLNETGRVTFGKADVAGDINTNVTIYQDKNNNNILDSGESIGSLIGANGSVDLQAGVYYVLANQSNVSNTAYSLSISS
ncbi:MAG: PPC domain-containing protein [Drouetiella hepatica Uher 2000/2452]|jgi:hypothetical protein|uniref:PPC domain-containing protein n=1 Tax=Drouetiella hepatica Uher 2000/2452 TaxID=904376 RepID=A0A951QGH8_9CYAN|nr:PPC domain-containing protein [Drouetiella hepatica Uher 2000/2452]